MAAECRCLSDLGDPECRVEAKIDALTHEAMLNSDREFLRKRASLPGYRPLYGAPVLLLLSGPADGPYSAVNAALAART